MLLVSAEGAARPADVCAAVGGGAASSGAVIGRVGGVVSGGWGSGVGGPKVWHEDLRDMGHRGLFSHILLLAHPTAEEDAILRRLLNPSGAPGFLLEAPSLQSLSPTLLEALLEPPPPPCWRRGCLFGHTTPLQPTMLARLRSPLPDPHDPLPWVPAPPALERRPLEALIFRLFPLARRHSAVSSEEGHWAGAAAQAPPGHWRRALALAEAKACVGALEREGVRRLESWLQDSPPPPVAALSGVLYLRGDPGRPYLLTATARHTRLEPLRLGSGPRPTPHCLLAAPGGPKKNKKNKEKKESPAAWLRQALEACRPFRPRARPPLGPCDLSPDRRAAVLRSARGRPLPPGWLFDGAAYVDMLGRRALERPDAEDIVGEWLCAANRRREREDGASRRLLEAEGREGRGESEGGPCN